MDDECKILTELRALVKSSSTMFTYKFIRKCQMFAYILNVKVNSQVSEFDGNPKKKSIYCIPLLQAHLSNVNKQICFSKK